TVLFEYKMRINQIIPADKTQSSQNNQPCNRNGHFIGILGQISFNQSCTNSKGNGADDYFECSFSFLKKGLFACQYTRKQITGSHQNSRSYFYTHSEHFHGTVHPNGS